MADQRLAVIGAAGYVGQELLRQLERAGIKATAVVRGAPELSVAGDFHDAVHVDDRRAQRFDVVINLAHPTSGLAYEYPLGRWRSLRPWIGWSATAGASST